MTPLILTRPTPDIRLAAAADVNFVVNLQKKFTGELGFLPAAALKSYVAAERLMIGVENDDNAGYIVGRNALRYDPSIAPITQAAVCMDARRRHLGLRLVEQWANAAKDDGRHALQCWCADDIDAVHFWNAAGFTPIARRDPKNARGRTLTLFRRPLRAAFLADDLRTLPPLAGYRASKIGEIVPLDGSREVRRPKAEQMFLFDVLTDDGRLTAFD